ncbi:MAG: InlB B-repeat-containing protein, partial [Lachnospiraceae bacterium]|nr:InlB B-repeat-containing protein [Lachnospiraceae bacterium]
MTTTKGLQENVTLYAKWVKENIIVYDDGTGNVLSDKVTYGKNYKIKAVANREKEALVGWWTYQWGERVYFDPEQTIVLYAPTGECETEVLHAIWQSEFDINYENIDDEEIYGMEDAPTGYDYGEVTLIPSPYREGYSFEGWYTDSKFKTKI